MRDCPTVEGSSIPLIIHRIQVSDCLTRQQCNYHKCHRCVFRGKAADWQPREAVHAGERTGERAVPSRLVEVPRPEGAPGQPEPTKKQRKSRKRAPQPTSTPS